VNKHKACACLLAFLFLVPLPMSIPVGEAESISGSVVKIVSPISTTYDRRVLLLNVTFSYGGLRYDLTYNLDGATEGSIPMGEYQPPNNEFHLINTAYAWVTLPELGDGPHSVTVTLVARVHYSGGGKPSAPFQPTSPGSSEYSATWSDTVQFNVRADESYEPQPHPAADSTPPEISNLSVQNQQTYPSQDIPLNFTLNGSASRIAYSLDGGDNVTIDGNTTLHGLSAGKHNVTVFCWDDAGNVGASETTSFIVKAPFPITSVVATGLFVIAVAAVAGLVYRKRKRRDMSQ